MAPRRTHPPASAPSRHPTPGPQPDPRASPSAAARARSASATCDRWRRIARSAMSPLAAAIAWTIAVCSRSERSLPAGEEDGPVLEADDLGHQRPREPARGLVARDLEDPPVQRCVGVRHRHEVAALAVRAHVAEDRAQVAHVLRGRPFRRPPRRQALERGADLDDLDRLLLGDAPDPRAAMAFVLDEAVVLEADQRHADGGAPDAEPAAQVLLDEALARQQVARHDRVAQGPVSVVVDHASSSRLSTRLSTM